VFQSSGAAQRVTVRFLGAGLSGPIDLAHVLAIRRQPQQPLMVAQ
jgi:hypothetical protein